MFKKYLIVTCRKNPAGMNIVNSLSQFRKNPLLSSMSDQASFDIYITEEESLYDENLDMKKINQYDFIIFPYTHKSEKGEKSLCVHTPGNWRDAKLGGSYGKICPSSALFFKKIFENLNEIAKKYELDKKYNITLEATHHGPFIEKPCLFIEIGSSETEWNDRQASFVVAKTIAETIQNFKENPYNEVAIAIGGPHYCPNFNKIQLKSNIAISHVIPNYSVPITEDMIKEAIEKTEEDVDFALVDWKGLGISEERQKIIDTLD